MCKGIVLHFGKHVYLLCSELNDKIDTTFIHFYIFLEGQSALFHSDRDINLLT